MKEKFVAKVPEKLIGQPQLSARSHWIGRYNVACWIRLQHTRPCKIVLLLKYVDQEGTTKAVTVDQCSTELGSTMLLSGMAQLPALGKILDLGVYLESTENCPPYIIDELFVQAADQSSSRANKLISAA